jgi:alkylation response protein AidB-like acyl-CoA dehydrogenase
MGSIYLDGSEEQKKKWLPAMARWEKIGCFGLTAPLVGSGASGGLLTTARRDGDSWILNGQKRWIGNSPWCDLSIIWARDEADNQVKGFIVENKSTPGFGVEKLEHKIALKVVQMGAYEAALKYAQERKQFGKPIAAFQMIQDLLAKMLGNVTACQCMMLRLAQMNDDGLLGDHHAALAKAFCKAKSRETVAWGARNRRRERHHCRLRCGAVLCRCRSAVFLRGYLSDAKSDRWKGNHRFRRVHLSRWSSAVPLSETMVIRRTRWSVFRRSTTSFMKREMASPASLSTGRRF